MASLFIAVLILGFFLMFFINLNVWFGRDTSGGYQDPSGGLVVYQGTSKFGIKMKYVLALFFIIRYMAFRFYVFLPIAMFVLTFVFMFLRRWFHRSYVHKKIEFYRFFDASSKAQLVPLLDTRADVSALSEIKHANPLYMECIIGTAQTGINNTVGGYMTVMQDSWEYLLLMFNVWIREPGLSLLVQIFTVPPFEETQCDCRFDNYCRTENFWKLKCTCRRLWRVKTVHSIKKVLVSGEIIMQLLAGNIRGKTYQDVLTKLEARVSRVHTVNLDRALNAKHNIVDNSLMAAAHVAWIHQQETAESFPVENSVPSS
jgi:hypothetical protein